MPPPDPPIRDRLRIALTQAMKERDRTAVAVLRSTLGAIDNAEAVAPTNTEAGDVPRRLLDEREIVAIVLTEAAQLRVDADGYDAVDRSTEADELRARAEVLETIAG